MLTIANDGPRITASSYWGSESDRAGRMSLDTDTANTWRCSLWGPGPTCLLDLPARYRRVPKLPCLKEWGWRP